MSNILLLSPQKKEKFVFPMGIAYVASSLMQSGYNVIGRDLNFVEEREFNELVKEEYTFIGITGFSFNFYSVESLIEKILQKNKSPIVLGGMIVNSYPEFIARNLNVDFCVYGEGEKTSVELANYLSGNGNKIEHIPGIVYRDNGIVKINKPAPLIRNLDEIPFPAWKIFKAERYFCNSNPYRREAILLSSKGCPGKCTFCFRDYGGRYRSRGPENVVAEIESLKEQYGIEYIRFKDECFYFKEKELERFCKLMIERKINIGWDVSMRLDNIRREENYRLMRRAGCDHIHFGIETGSEKMMKVIKKNLAKPKMLNSLQLAKKTKIYISSSYVLGMPGEDIDTLNETVEFEQKASCDQVNAYFPIAFPSTWLYDYAKSNNIINNEVEYLRSTNDLLAGNLKINYTKLPEEILTGYKEKLELLGRGHSNIDHVIYRARNLIKNKQYLVLIKMILYLFQIAFSKILPQRKPINS